MEEFNIGDKVVIKSILGLANTDIFSNFLGLTLGATNLVPESIRHLDSVGTIVNLIDLFNMNYAILIKLENGTEVILKSSCIEKVDFKFYIKKELEKQGGSDGRNRKRKK